MEVKIPEMRLIVPVAVDAGIDELVLEGIRLVEHIQQEGGGLRTDEGIEPGIGLFLGRAGYGNA
jgi:hypothetical protein